MYNDVKFVSQSEAKAILSQDTSLRLPPEFRTSTIKCFYCGGDTANREFCQFCNGPLEEGYPFLCYYYGQPIYLDILLDV